MKILGFKKRPITVITKESLTADLAEVNKVLSANPRSKNRYTRFLDFYSWAMNKIETKSSEYGIALLISLTVSQKTQQEQPSQWLYYQVRPADEYANIVEFNKEEARRCKANGITSDIQFCNVGFEMVPIDFRQGTHGFKTGTFTCLQLNRAIDDLAIDLGKERKPEDMLDYAASIEVYAWALHRLATRSIQADLVISFTWKD